MSHHVAIPAVIAVGLACGIFACGDAAAPSEPVVAPLVLQRGGPPIPGDIPLQLDEFASFVCGFPVYQQFTGRQKVLELPGGRTITVFPGLKGQFINGNTGASVSFSSTGSVHENPLPGGGTEIVLVGRNPVLFDVGGEFFFQLVSGRFTVVFGPDGSLVQQFDGNGRRVDVCELLA